MHILLPLASLPPYTDERARYLHMTNMLSTLSKDPDLSEIHIQSRPKSFNPFT